MAVKKFISELAESSEKIPNSRKEALEPLITTIGSSLKTHDKTIVQFICTHNSRRSQTAEFFLDIFAREYKLNITALSAGTESTAFNPRMVEAIRSFGFELIKYGDDRNPLYIYGLINNELYYYSKRYDEELIEFDKKIVVTVCGDANENCPIVPGTFERLHLGYKDPKFSDNTSEEEKVYKAKVIEIGNEMLYVVQQLAQSN